MVGGQPESDEHDETKGSREIQHQQRPRTAIEPMKEQSFFIVMQSQGGSNEARTSPAEEQDSRS